MTEWIVDARGCDATPLRSLEALQALCARIVAELDLRVVGESSFAFPAPGGVTLLYLLRESHLACHTYPETGLVTFNLFCCRPRPDWPWRERLGEALGSVHVEIQKVPRG
jgi:S-adenosylmethionine decarboxylase